MKTIYHSLILLSTLIALPVLSMAQPKITQPTRKLPTTVNPNLLQRAPLDWYFRALRPATKTVNSSANQTFGSTQSGGNTSTVGVNLPRAASNIRTNGTPKTTPSGDGYCVTQAYNLDYLNESAFSLVDLRLAFPNAIFPGALINAGSLLSKNPIIYSTNAPRRPLSIAISISNPDSGSRVYNVTDFGRNNIRLLDENLRDKHYGAAIPSVFAYRSMELKSQQELTASLNYSTGLMLPLEQFGIPIDLSQGFKANGSTTSTTRQHQYMMSFIQPMYAYTVEEEDPALIFNNPGTAAGINDAGMVRSIIYGRMIMLTFSSTLDSTEAFARVSGRLGIELTGGELANASFGAFISSDVKTRFTRDIKEFKAMVYGGNGATANSMAGDPDSVFRYLRDPSAATLGRTTGALPLQYVIQRVSDGSVIGVRSTAGYTVDDCLSPRYDVEIVFKGLKCYKVVEGLGDNEEDIFGTCHVNGKSLLDINENAAWSIAVNKTLSDDKEVLIASNMTLAQLRELQLVFNPVLKDWEPFHKPVYRAYQPLDLKYSFDKTSTINSLMNINAGRSIDIENKTHEVRLYENGDKDHSSIAVLYRVKVTRK
ncbi:thiol-activated cytolysin family protein [Nostoc ellipsosporum NOK]|nr:thiol-activated cytolysin family protein [Nostoc ellipsosporum NOK]